MQMTTVPYISDHRDKYMDPLGPGQFVVGNADELIDSGVEIARIPWGRAIPESDRHRVRSLSLRPKPTQLKSLDIPKYVASLENLEHLEIPFAFLPSLDPGGLPKTLRNLQISYDAECFGKIAASTVKWPAGVFIPGIKGLSFAGSYDHAWPSLCISKEHLPQLEYLHATLNGNESAASAIERLPNLIHLELFVAKNMSLFGSLPDSVEYLYLNSTGLRFDASGVTRLRRLRSASLLYVKAPLDIEWLAELPALVELEMVGVKKLKNVESLLSLAHIKRLKLVDCGKPFAKELKEKLKSSNYDSLDIKYA